MSASANNDEVRYCVDTSGIMNAWNRTHPPDVFPSLWDRIEALGTSGRIIVSEEVVRELEVKDDFLVKWVQQAPFTFWPLDDDIQSTVRDVMRRFPRITDGRSNKNYADPFVVATAIVADAAVVTEESPGTADRPTIPFMCAHFDVNCFGIVGMMQFEQWRF